MSGKTVAALLLMGFGVLLFLVAGFTIEDVEDFDLVALGLASFGTGFMIEHFVKPQA